MQIPMTVVQTLFTPFTLMMTFIPTEDSFDLFETLTILLKALLILMSLLEILMTLKTIIIVLKNPIALMNLL